MQGEYWNRKEQKSVNLVYDRHSTMLRWQDWTLGAETSQAVPPKGAHFLISKICDYIMLRGKEELRLQMKFIC